MTIRSSESLAIGALILGIVALFTFWAFPLCALSAAAAVLLGRLAESQAEHQQKGSEEERSKIVSTARTGSRLALGSFALSMTLYVSCFMFAKRSATQGRQEFERSFRALKADPQFKKQLTELKSEFQKIDEAHAAQLKEALPPTAPMPTVSNSKEVPAKAASKRTP